MLVENGRNAYALLLEHFLKRKPTEEELFGEVDVSQII